MKKYSVYGMVSGSVFLGEYEADTEEEAIDMANDNPEANWSPSLCHHCANEVDLGDIYDAEANEQ